MAKTSPFLDIEETEEKFPVSGFPSSKSQEQRRQAQNAEDASTRSVVIQLSKEDFSKLSALSNSTTIPVSILSRALLRQAISHYSLADGLNDLYFQPSQSNSLTDREADILNLIAQGLSNRGIASALKISEQTVKNHITAILRKMKANNRTQAASLAFKNNLVQFGMTE